MRRRVRKRGRRGLGVVVAGREEVEEEGGGGWAAIDWLGWVASWRVGLLAWQPPGRGVLVLARGGLRMVFVGGVYWERVARLCPLSGVHLVFVSLRCVVLGGVGFTGVGVRRYLLV